MTHKPPRRLALSMVELIVVVAILAVLIGLLLPSVQKARAAANRVACASNLHQIGVALMCYRDDHQYFPSAALLPSMGGTTPSLAGRLAPYVGQDSPVFRCPEDGKLYPTEKISYQYRNQIAYYSLEELEVLFKGTTYEWVVMDFDPFHGLPGTEHARLILYLDGHVE